jgi:hypothetical protein
MSRTMREFVSKGDGSEVAYGGIDERHTIRRCAGSGGRLLAFARERAADVPLVNL